MVHVTHDALGFELPNFHALDISVVQEPHRERHDNDRDGSAKQREDAPVGHFVDDPHPRRRPNLMTIRLDTAGS